MCITAIEKQALTINNIADLEVAIETAVKNRFEEGNAAVLNYVERSRWNDLPAFKDRVLVIEKIALETYFMLYMRSPRYAFDSQMQDEELKENISVRFQEKVPMSDTKPEDGIIFIGIYRKDADGAWSFNILTKFCGVEFIPKAIREDKHTREAWLDEQLHHVQFYFLGIRTEMHQSEENYALDADVDRCPMRTLLANTRVETF